MCADIDPDANAPGASTSPVAPAASPAAYAADSTLPAPELRLVRPDEFETLMSVMNAAFGFDTPEARFEHILPKLYYPENTSMIHIGAYVDGQLAGSIGLYPMELVHGSRTLQTACVGAVSTLPAFRKRGIFSALMRRTLEEAANRGFSLLFLGGDRLRYGRFGFEYGGRNLLVSLTKRTECLLRPEPFEVRPYEAGTVAEDEAGRRQCDADGVAGACALTEQLLAVYDREPMRVRRTAAEFPAVLRSWNSKAYYVTNPETDGIIGYFALNGHNHVTEFCCMPADNSEFSAPRNASEAPELCGTLPVPASTLDTMFAALLSVAPSASVVLPMSFHTPYVLGRVGHYEVAQNHMFKILDEAAVISFLGGEPERVFETLEALRPATLSMQEPQEPAVNGTVSGTTAPFGTAADAYNKLRLRLILGDSAADSLTGTNLFIDPANSG